MAIAALVQFAEWEEWVALDRRRHWSSFRPGSWGLRRSMPRSGPALCSELIVALASISEIWIVHHPAITAK